MIRFIASRQSYLIAAVITLSIIGWLFSGDPLSAGVEENYTPPSNGLRETDSVPVRYALIKPESFRPVIMVSGKSEPTRRVDIRAETSGRVVTINAKKGAFVKQGETILTLDMRERKKQLDFAKAMLKQRKLEYNVAQKLYKKDFSTETRVAEAEAGLAAAESDLAQIKLDIANTTIKAPFDGILDQRPSEIGDYISAGDMIARIVEMNPIVFTGTITEREIPYIHLGDTGIAKMITGSTAEGKIRYIAAESDPITRTFRIELEAENPDISIPAGITSELHITTQPITAHRLPPSLLSINNEGRVGVKSIDENSRVQFVPIEILISTSNETWIRGLNGNAKIITVGQGFVQEGDVVSPVLDSAFNISSETSNQ